MTGTASGGSFAYDANGNMITRVLSGTTTSLAYDAENRLISATVGSETTRYVYDGDGTLVAKVAGGQTTVYVGAHYEKNLTTGVVTKYYLLGGQRVAMRVDGTVTWIHANHLGSASLTTNDSGAVVGEMRYYPYGQTRWTTGTVGTDRRYTGQREEAGLGLYDYVARRYDPALGQFLQADTIVPEPGNPQSLNRYSYAMNSPLKYIDPNGHSVSLAVIAVFALAGAVGSGIGYVASSRLLHNPVDPVKLSVAVGVGAVSGALAPVASFAGLVGLGAAANVLNEVVPAAITGESVNATEVAVSAGVGALFGAASGALGGGSNAIEQYMSTLAAQPLREAIGSGSAEFGRDLARQAFTEVTMEAVREGGRTAFWEFFSNVDTDSLMSLAGVEYR